MALKFVETIKRVTEHGDQIIINMDGYTTFKGLVAVMHDVARAIKKYDAGFARDLAQVRTIADAKSYLQPYMAGVEQWYIFEVEEVPCASKLNEETDEIEYSDGANYFHVYFLIDNPNYTPASDDGQGTSDVYSFESFDHYTNRGAYAVRMYTKRGDGYGVTYASDFEAAKDIRTRHGLSIGLEPEPTYKDFAYYPTIWEWNDGKGHYERVLGY